ncbi:MAG: hypothetical protein ABJE10_19810 [bacterium]
MRVSPSSLLVALLIALPAVTSAQATPASAPPMHPKPAQLPADSLERARKWTMWLYTSQNDSLFAQLDSGFKAGVETPKGMDDFAIQLATDAGSEIKVIGEKFITRNGKRQYWRTATFTSLSEPLVVRLVMSAKGELVGIGMNPLSQVPPIDP